MKRAIETFFAGDVQVPAGALVADDDVILEGRESLFADEETELPAVPSKRTRKQAATA